jgi:transposase InsO family protein
MLTSAPIPSTTNSKRPTLQVTFKHIKHQITALADIGSDVTLASLKEVRCWKIPWTKHQVNLLLADGTSFKSLGFLTVDVLIEDTHLQVKVQVVQTLGYPLILGCDTLEKLPVRFQYGHRILFSGHIPPVLTPRHAPELTIGEGIRSFSPIPAENQEVHQLLLKHKNVVSQWCKTPGLLRAAAFRIPTGSASPIYRKAIPMSAPHLKYLQNHLADYQGRNMVRPSNSPWGAPTFLVPKAGTSEMRVCHDYRQLNKITESSGYPIPSANQLQDVIGTENRFFAKIDLRWGYNQIPIETADIPKTAITSPLGKHEWLVMGFGFKDAPLYFQSVIEGTIGDILHKGVVVYLDDLLVYAKTFKEFMRILDIVLGRLDAAGAKIHLGKSDFLPRELKYLGMLFTPQGVFHLPDRVKKLNSYPEPQTKKQLLSFLGFANYFRTFIPKFSSHEAQLRSLETRAFKYTTADHQAFQYLRTAVTTDSSLASFEADAHTEVHVDASGTGLGAILIQRQASGSMRVVSYASRLLSPVEQRYSNTERELLAIQWAICDRFRLQLLGHPFQVHTDHAALVNECRLRNPTSRIHRMLLKLDAFDYTLVHRPGTQNLGADFLSRFETDVCPQPLQPVPRSPEKILVAAISMTPPTSISHTDIMKAYHVEGLNHLGFTKTYDAIARRFSWSGLRKDVQDYVSSCVTCQKFTKPVAGIIKPVQPIRTQRPHELLCVDVVGPLPLSNGRKYILVAIDHYSKFTWAKPVAHATSVACCHFLGSIFRQHGPWVAISTDNAQAFCTREFSSLLSKYSIEHRFCSPSHPEGNGCVERFIRTLRQLLRKNSSTTTWSGAIVSTLSAYNAAKHTATQASPIEVYAQKPATLAPDARFGISAPPIRPAKKVTWYQDSYAKPASPWKLGCKLWHIPRTRSDKKLSAVRHFQAQRFGPYIYLGPSHRLQHASVQKGRKTFSLPLWELKPIF